MGGCGRLWEVVGGSGRLGEAAGECGTLRENVTECGELIFTLWVNMNDSHTSLFPFLCFISIQWSAVF